MENLEKDLTQNPDVTASASEVNEVVNPLTAEEPKAEEPKEEPKAEEPKEEPKAEEPKEEPKAEEPKEEPKAEEPKEEPKAEEPKEEPKAEEPKEEPKAEEPKEEPKAEEPKEEAKHLDLTGKSKEDLVEMLKELAQRSFEEVKDEIQILKSVFFGIRREELAKEREAFVAENGEEAPFKAKEDETENAFKALLDVLKEKKAEFNEAQEAQREANLERKREIIQQILDITNDPDNINREFNKVKQLQQDFKEVGDVPPQNETEIWKSFQQATEKFYDLLKINKELRDYDFKKNLEAKQALCAEAEALDEESDVVQAFRKLQQLHIKWREIGPVAKELREDLWARFKAASAVINKKYQSFFEERKGLEKENADAKTALCEAIESMSTEGLKSYAAWDEATKKIIELQEQWKKLGFASRKLNTALFTRFRKSCDEFFSQKAEFFKQTKEAMAANLERKLELCEKAEALKDSTEWKKATDAFVALQKEWKTIGPVVKKHSDAVWQRFIAACDHFFEQKKAQSNSQHSMEHDNLKSKKEVIKQLQEVLNEEDTEAAATTIRDLMGRWQGIGHVPFKEKDKVYAEYREALDAALDKFGVKPIRASLAGYGGSSSSRGEGSERDRLVRTYEQKRNELKTLENNLGFFNAQSKSGNSLVKEFERKIENLKEEINALEVKIKELDKAQE